VGGVGVTSPSSSSSTEAHLETVRAAVDAFNRRDVEAMRALGGDDFVYDWSRSMAPNRGIYRGPEGFIEFAEEQWDMFSELQIEPQEPIPRGNHVVVPITVRARGREDIPVSANSAMLYTFEGARLVRITLYQGREEALAAATD
jgi:ketosteroid isomerase-like protein